MRPLLGLTLPSDKQQSPRFTNHPLTTCLPSRANVPPSASADPSTSFRTSVRNEARNGHHRGSQPKRGRGEDHASAEPRRRDAADGPRNRDPGHGSTGLANKLVEPAGGGGPCPR